MRLVRLGVEKAPSALTAVGKHGSVLEDENGQEVFLGFHPDACVERTRWRIVRVHK